MTTDPTRQTAQTAQTAQTTQTGQTAQATQTAHIHILLDRSGSMHSIREDVIGGFNAFLAEQKALPGHATLTLVQFDTQDPYERVHQFQALSTVPDLTAATYSPRGSTPLLDALGRGMEDLDASLAMLTDEQRPRDITFVVLTDGAENASQRFRKADIDRMIAARKEAGIDFVFLSSDLGAVHEALDRGIDRQAVLLFQKSAAGVRHGLGAMGREVREKRSGRKRDVAFVKEDRVCEDDPMRAD